MNTAHIHVQLIRIMQLCVTVALAASTLRLNLKKERIALSEATFDK